MSMSRADEVTRQLRERIVDGRIAAGERLPSEPALGEEFGASRTVIREALQRLQSAGLVRTRRGAGSYALTPPPETTDGPGWLHAGNAQERRELHAFRTAVEAEAAALAARHAGPGELAQITTALAVFDAAGTPADSLEADFAFHRAVAAASGNTYLRAALEHLGPGVIVMPTARRSGEGEGAWTSAAAEHRVIAEAVASGDALAASAAMRAHLLASLARSESGPRP